MLLRTGNLLRLLQAWREVSVPVGPCIKEEVRHRQGLHLSGNMSSECLQATSLP